MPRRTGLPPPNKRKKASFEASEASTGSEDNGDENYTAEMYDNYIFAPEPQQQPPPLPVPSLSSMGGHPEEQTGYIQTLPLPQPTAQAAVPMMQAVPGLPQVPAEIQKYRSEVYSRMEKQSFPKYVAQIASTLNSEANDGMPELSPEASIASMKLYTGKRGPSADSTTAPMAGIATNSSSNTSSSNSTTTTTTANDGAISPSKSLGTMGNSNNKFFGVSKGQSSSSSSSSSSSTGGNDGSVNNGAGGTGSNSSNIIGGSSGIGGIGNIGGTVGNIGLLGSWFPPPQARWFRIDTIHDIEKRALPEFFSGKCPTKTPQIYKEYRDFMVTSYRQNIKPPPSVTGASGAYHPHHNTGASSSSSSAAAGSIASTTAAVSSSSSAGGMGDGTNNNGSGGGGGGGSAAGGAGNNAGATGISFTMCRRYLTGDVSAIYQVFRFLEHWGLIANHKTGFVIDGTGCLPLECPLPGADPAIVPSAAAGSMAVAAEIAAGIPPSSLPPPPPLQDEELLLLQRTHTRGRGAAVKKEPREEDDRRAKKEEGGNDDSEEDDEEGGGGAGAANGGEIEGEAEALAADYGSHHCVYIEHTAGIPESEDGSGSRWIRYEDVLGDERDIWTDQETFLLLEALKTQSSWAAVSRYVATKTPRQCFEHFLRLPINQQLPQVKQEKEKEEDNPTDLRECRDEDSYNDNAVDALAELIRSTPGCTDALAVAAAEAEAEGEEADGLGGALDVAARVGLGIARSRATALAREEEAAVEDLLAEAIDAQAQKVDIKLRYLSKYERQLQSEWDALAEVKNSLLTEKVVLVSSFIKSKEAMEAAAAATVADMITMEMDMGAVQEQIPQQQQQHQQQQQQHQQDQMNQQMMIQQQVQMPQQGQGQGQEQQVMPQSQHVSSSSSSSSSQPEGPQQQQQQQQEQQTQAVPQQQRLPRIEPFSMPSSLLAVDDSISGVDGIVPDSDTAGSFLTSPSLFPTTSSYDYDK